MRVPNAPEEVGKLKCMYCILHCVTQKTDLSEEKKLPKLTVTYLNPSTEIIPAMLPINIAAKGKMFKSAQEPTATPPAKVAF